jgi:hypothetical protein
MSSTSKTAIVRRYTTLADPWRAPIERDKNKRAISRRSSGAGRGAHVYKNREIRTESNGESKGFYVFSAHPDVVNIEDQSPVVVYHDEFGKRRVHIFDALITLRDGRRYAVEFKPERFAEAARKMVGLIAAQVAGVVDGFLVVTDAQLTRDVVHNAQMMRMAEDGDSTADEKVREIVAGLPGAMSIGDIVTSSGLQGEAFRATCRLIRAGEISIPKGARIDLTTLVKGERQ